jgi:hypothetical protein
MLIPYAHAIPRQMLIPDFYKIFNTNPEGLATMTQVRPPAAPSWAMAARHHDPGEAASSTKLGHGSTPP